MRSEEEEGGQYQSQPEIVAGSLAALLKFGFRQPDSWLGRETDSALAATFPHLQMPRH